jgi:ubiquinone/menaquinone biosynthesis C-methylase UbiE
MAVSKSEKHDKQNFHMNDFDLKAKEWDMNPMHTERSITIARQMIGNLPLTKTMKAMEFGAGTGLLSFYLQDHFAEITLMDSSEEMLKQARLKFGSDNHLKINTAYLNLEQEEYNAGTFDIIYSQMVLHHIKDINSIIKKFYRLLNPGGILAIADLYKEDGSFHDGDMTVHPGFDPEKLVSLLRVSNFTVSGILPCFIIRKETKSEEIKEYPVFLLTANK